jgi:hypothetical protein
MARSTQAVERRAKALEVWDQIRRTEKVLMETGTIERALLQEQRVGAEGAVNMVEGLSRMVA